MLINKLIEHFLQFPGIGPRQAKRFAYFLADKDEPFLKELSRLILEVKKNVKQCEGCYSFFENNTNREQKLCKICSSPNRDTSSLLIIEKDVDLTNIEKTGIYNGNYFVIGGVISLTKSNEKELRFKPLFEKVKNEKPTEIILALSANTEGENTNRYIEKILEPLSSISQIKITKFGRGLSTGTELEYSDSETISNALNNRK